MPGRKIGNREDALACLEAVSTSGLSRVEWAHANGVDARSLQAWRVVIERKLKPPTPLQLVELVPTSARHFLAPGWLAPVDLARDANGHVTTMISCELDSLPLARIH